MKDQQNNSRYLGYDCTNKSTDSVRLIQSVCKLSSLGGKFTVKGLSSSAGTNDAWKLISILRHKEGWQVGGCCLSNGCKLYWLAGKGGANE